VYNLKPSARPMYWIGEIIGDDADWDGSHQFDLIPVGESRTIFIQCQLESQSNPQTIPNTATVQEGDNGCPKSASVNLRICPVTDLGIEKYDKDPFNPDWPFDYPYDPAEDEEDYVDRFNDPVTAGGSILDYDHHDGEDPYADPPLTYAIVVTNHGASPAANVMLEDTLPDCLEEESIEFRVYFDDAEGDTVSDDWSEWTEWPDDNNVDLGSIPYYDVDKKNNYKIVEIQGHVKASTPPDYITNTASVSSSGSETRDRS